MVEWCLVSPSWLCAPRRTNVSEVKTGTSPSFTTCKFSGYTLGPFLTHSVKTNTWLTSRCCGVRNVAARAC